MRRVTRLALVAGGTSAVVAGGALARSRLVRREPDAPIAEEAQYTVYAPGGPWGFLFNGPVGWASTKYMPIMQAGAVCRARRGASGPAARR